MYVKQFSFDLFFFFFLKAGPFSLLMIFFLDTSFSKFFHEIYIHIVYILNLQRR